MAENVFNPEQLAYVEPTKKPRKFSFLKPNKKAFVISLIFVFGIVMGAGGIFGYLQLKKTPVPVEQLQDDKPPQEVLGLIETVEKKVPNIPKNEIPSVATVKDLADLSDQEFLAGAKVGDRIMIYSASKRAILYRPSTNEVIRQGPVEIIGEETDEAEKASSSAVLSASDSAVPALRIKY